MQQRRWVGWIVASILVGCAANPAAPDAGEPPGMDGAAADASEVTGDGGPIPDGGEPPGMDGGRPTETAGTCESCERHEDCGTGAFCVSLSVGGRACVPSCVPDIPTCPRAFNCVLDVSSGVDTTVCLPVGGTCCVDDDADEYGQGVGCMGADCADDDELVNPGESETCNGVDDDCDGTVDDPPTDCVSGRCTLQPDGSYESVMGADCVDGACAMGTVTPCALYSCEDGGESGNRCATSCDRGAGDEDALCIGGAHCDAGVCTMDVPDGGTCDEDTDCTSTHCENGFCCRSGSCCGVADDCPGTGGIGAVCDDPTTCQGSRGALVCIDSTCATTAGIPDDSACTSTTMARDCGLYAPLFCTGAVDQPPPACPTSCTDDTGCVASAHCEVGVCAPDRTMGGGCSRLEDCASGLFCVDGRCCDRACSGTCEACDLPGTEGTCRAVPAMGDPDGECPTLSCAGYYAGFDALGRCFRHTDVPDAIAACDGAGSCLDAATLCPMQPAGGITIDCDDSCQSPTSGTCAGTTAGTCDDLDDPAVTLMCGVGECSASVQRCMGGALATCTSGAPSSEACNAVDDDCDGRTDEGDAAVLCPPGANVNETGCAMGGCGIVSCDPLFADCDGSLSTGCERPLTTLTNCGACGTTCTLPHATETCGSGVCEIASCDAGWADCDGVDSNGCETSTTTLSDCGGCGVACDLANAAESCGGGSCTIVSCDSGWGDCDGFDATGCERSLRTLSDCGSCGTACSIAGASESCATGTCEPSSCDPGRADCDSDATNGCETSITTLSDCGGCGVPCDLTNASESCSSGTCTLISCTPGYEDCDGSGTNGCETSTRTLSNCGACGTICDLAHASETCSSGACALVACDPGWGNCDGMVANGCETSLTTVSDCGGCGVPCGLSRATESCATGACTITSCDAGWGDCDGTTSTGCETPLTTLSDCGGCGAMCALSNATETCGTGICSIMSCDSLYADCDSSAATGCERPINTLSDCGGCGVGCDLANGSETCASGSCALVGCDSGYGNCDFDDGNGCERTLNTLSDCGGCGTICSLAHASESCATGACLLSSCDPLYADCDGVHSNGCERATNTLSDCGGCGVSCDLANASESCSTGTCTLGACAAGYRDCDGIAATGCERSITTLSDCGACGVTCDLANASESCSSGSCTLGTCSAGWANCDGIASNGCETSTATLTDCGGCGVACNRPNASATCASGTCAIDTCSAGWEDCDGSDGNGCETSTATLTDCGGCGVTCSRTNATATCSGGTCGIGTCDSGYTDCDGVDSNGCETSTASMSDCGGCGMACSRANATASCSSGTCEISSCNPGYADCDGTDANGCETPTTTLSSCGGCGVVCSLANAGESCATGMCLITACSAGWADCDGLASNGCETSTRTLSNCGGCGVTCSLANASETCSTGTCAISSCDSSYGNCDGSASNGCETSLTTLSNCGGCGVGCSLANASETCSTGTCAIDTCSPGYGNCDGAASNGCERNLSTDVSYCGSCSTNCQTLSHPGATGEACVGGSCEVTMCTAGYYDQNGVFSDGCECAADTHGDDCTAATDVGTVVLAGTASRTGNLVAAGDSDWFRVTFASSNSCSWRPSITLSNGGLPIAMRIYTSCSSGSASGGQSCTAEGGTSGGTNITSWEYNHSSTCGDRMSIDNFPATGSYLTIPRTVWIRVFATGSSTSCLPYTLSMSS